MKDLQKKLRVALVQATPVMFNKDATINKVCAQIREAGANGAELIVFPESLIPCYPYGLTYGFTVGSRTEECRDDWKIYYDNAVLCPKTEYIQGELADGTTATVGMTIRVCKEWLGHANAGQAICYAWPIQPEQVEAIKKYPEDFTVTVIFQDQTLTYSLTDAGFLTKQPTQPDPMGNDGQEGGTP